jgi:hypothetical protein
MTTHGQDLDLEPKISDDEPQIRGRIPFGGEHSVSLRMKSASLGIWLLLNLILTLHSKMILGGVSRSPLTLMLNKSSCQTD